MKKEVSNQFNMQENSRNYKKNLLSLIYIFTKIKGTNIQVRNLFHELDKC